MPATRPHPSQRRRLAPTIIWTAAALATAFTSWTSTRAYLRANTPAGQRAAPTSMPAMPTGAMPAVPIVPTGELAAPAAGVTGTIALPALPAYAQGTLPESTTLAALPFSMGVAGALDRSRALECLTAAIHYEAASESDAGQRAVAQVILNRVRHPAFPATVCGVVYQGSERRGCQFSFACDGSMARVPSRPAWIRAARNAAAALAGSVYAPVGLATHYHTFAVTPAWNRGLVMTDVVGAHFFHRWKGWWGTANAFRQRYAGGEPVPGPHAPIVASPAVALFPASDLPVAIPPLPQRLSSVTDATEAVAGAIAPSSPAKLPTATPSSTEDRLPPASEVLDRWKDSGKPLR